MAIIVMDLEEYEKMKTEKFYCGFENGISSGVTEVLKWLKSGKFLINYLRDEGYFSCLKKDKNGQVNLLLEGSNWEKLLEELIKRGFRE